jgi:hypothetical protein
MGHPVLGSAGCRNCRTFGTRVPSPAQSRRIPIGAALAQGQDMKEIKAMNNQNKAVVEYWIKSVRSDQPLLSGLVFDGLTVNVNRARVSSHDAWFRLEVSGTASAIDTFLHRRSNEFMVVQQETAQVA